MMSLSELFMLWMFRFCGFKNINWFCEALGIIEPMKQVSYKVASQCTEETRLLATPHPGKLSRLELIWSRVYHLCSSSTQLSVQKALIYVTFLIFFIYLHYWFMKQWNVRLSLTGNMFRLFGGYPPYERNKKPNSESWTDSDSNDRSHYESLNESLNEADSSFYLTAHGFDESYEHLVTVREVQDFAGLFTLLGVVTCEPIAEHSFFLRCEKDKLCLTLIELPDDDDDSSNKNKNDNNNNNNKNGNNNNNDNKNNDEGNNNNNKNNNDKNNWTKQPLLSDLEFFKNIAASGADFVNEAHALDVKEIVAIYDSYNNLDSTASGKCWPAKRFLAVVHQYEENVLFRKFCAEHPAVYELMLILEDMTTSLKSLEAAAKLCKIELPSEFLISLVNCSHNNSWKNSYKDRSLTCLNALGVCIRLNPTCLRVGIPLHHMFVSVSLFYQRLRSEAESSTFSPLDNLVKSRAIRTCIELLSVLSDFMKLKLSSDKAITPMDNLNKSLPQILNFSHSSSPRST